MANPSSPWYKPSAPAPRYAHDCGQCRFLGHVRWYDAYFCADEDSIILRASSEESDYGAMPRFACIAAGPDYHEASLMAA